MDVNMDTWETPLAFFMLNRFFLYIFVSEFKNKKDSPSIHFKYLCSEKIITFDRSGESWSSFGFYNVNNLKKGRLSILFL